MKKLVALTMATAMTLSLAACGGASSSSAASTATTDTASSAAESTASEAEDTITVMVPPVTGDYLDKMTEWADEFHEMYPNLTMEVIGTSWDDHTTKLSTMAQAGEAPDISEISYAGLATYVENGTALNLSEYMDKDQLADFDQNALDYMTVEYITIQSLGANKDMLEAAGVDVAKVQESGWTYDEFMEAIKNGTKDGNRLKRIIKIGIYAVDAVLFSTITTSIYGFSDQAITASIEPMGMVISTASSALIQ